MITPRRNQFSCAPANHAPSACACLPRRGFLAGLGAASLAAPTIARAQTPAPKRRIDTHFHYFPTPYMPPLEAWWTSNSARGPLPGPVKSWTVAKALEEMDAGGVATGIASLPIPGARLSQDVELTKRYARESNEFGARMMADHPGRFGLFATLPFPDVDGCLKEIEYALDTLKADGIGMMTSYDGRYPGEAAFAPIFQELNRRKAAVYFHPNSPACCGSVIAGLNEGNLEYPYDTGRAILSLLLSGTLGRSHDTKFIFSHAGGPIIMLAGRIEHSAENMRNYKQVVPDGIDGELKRLYYDTANSVFPQNFAALLEFVNISQVLFGSDTPYISIADNVANFAKLKLKPEQLAAIERGNAQRLFPRLAG
jgi:predicted TIM-barrel fold metal-dependent hydrolase